ncbi:MAG: phosphotransferase, partial [Gemmatimonadetes bacterium]|nr:phosphotransferase [Gemmatimonadota bacterium]NIR78331.1 phosphotransferase [Gemmatimonadota bacterium]NIT86930.1 phosphotransferase [Gemmatimonadota bacterium]NIU30780.1 phosphotransferase [Gemmatimonadota bacterium]NIU35572.1 phosphotransferase [Gemmatimonadota bacterium]
FGVEPAEPPTPLPSDRDQNFRVVAARESDREAEELVPAEPALNGGAVDGAPPPPDAEPPAFVLKFASRNEDPAVLQLQHRALAHARKEDPGLALPRLRRTREGEALAVVEDGRGGAHRARMVTWLPGRPLAHVRPRTPELLERLGAYLGRLDRALESFRHPADERPLKWDLGRGPEVVKERLELIEEGARRTLVEEFLMRYWKRVVPRLEELPVQIIHGDANDHNLLVRVDGPGALHDAVRPAGIIDFGDMVRSRRVNEVAIACAYLALDEADPLGSAARVVAGYHGERPLEEVELACLFPLLALRLCVSVSVAAEQKREEPGDPYLTVSEGGAWRLLELLDEASPEMAHYRFREACGLTPCSATPRVVSWLEEQGSEAAPVLEPDPREADPVVLDFSVAGDAFPGLSPEAGPEAWWAAIRERMEAAGTPIALGRYDEPRRWYTSEVFAAGPPADPPELAPPAQAPEPRTVHLGVDLFAEPGTPVRAPLEGRVHSLANNAGALDYGPTVVLQHDAEGIPFWTLYGHLAPGVLERLRPGQRVEAGEAFAALGTWPHNGGWAPHLHFQVVVDLLGREGDFPGVAAASESGLWKALSPDPNLLLGIGGLEAA